MGVQGGGEGGGGGGGFFGDGGGAGECWVVGGFGESDCVLVGVNVNAAAETWVVLGVVVEIVAVNYGYSGTFLRLCLHRYPYRS